MRLHKITIKGFGPIREPLTLAFDDGFTCITGETGNGKTTAFEALALALYGETPGYPGLDVYDHITDGETEGEVEAELECGGHEYKAIRRASIATKTPTHKAWLYRDGERIAGPRTRDVETVVAREIASRDIAFATFLCGQRIVGDLCYGNPPAGVSVEQHRRSLMCDLLKATGLSALSGKFLSRAGDLKKHAEILEAQGRAGEGLQARLEEAEANLSLTRHDLETATRNLAERRTELESKKDSLRRSEAEGRDALLAVIERHEQARKAWQSAVENLHHTRRERCELATKADSAASARIAVDRKRELTTIRDELTTRDAKFQAFRAWRDRRDRLKVDLDRADERRENLMDKARVPDDVKAAAASFDAVADEYRQARAKNEEAEKHNNHLRDNTESAKRDLAALTAKRKDIEARLARRPVTPGSPDVCDACPLLVEFRDLPSQLADINGKIRGVEIAIRNLDEAPRLETVDLSAIERRGHEARTARQRVEEAAKHAEALKEAERAADLASQAIKGHEANPVDAADDVSGELAEVRAELDRLSGAEERLAACQEAAAKLADAETRLAALTTAEAEALKAERGLATEADVARKTLADKDGATVSLRKEIEATGKAVGELEASVASLTRDTATLEAAIKHTSEQIEAHAAKVAEAKTLRDRETACRFLRDAFGPKGIQALLVDQHAAPALESIADEIFQTASNGQMRLRIVTQEPDSKGAMKETFRILVSGVDGTRDFSDIRKYSGGESSMIRFVFRVALLLFVMQKTGRDLSVLMLDEPLEGMSDNWKRAALATIREYLPKFTQIVVVTHDAGFSSSSDHRITIQKTPLGARTTGGAVSSKSPAEAVA